MKSSGNHYNTQELQIKNISSESILLLVYLCKLNDIKSMDTYKNFEEQNQQKTTFSSYINKS